jgi:DNA-binding response OmpR family regulator
LLLRILLVEDDQRLARSVSRGLREEGYTVDHAPDGNEADLLVDLRPYELIILDRMLPGISGDQLLAKWRRKELTTPILMLTALDAVADRVTGLRAGADDYLIKPFAFDELLARLEALVRRTSPARTEGSVLRAGPLALDTQTSRLSCGSESVELSATEFRLMALFMRHPGQILTRTAIVHSVWQEPESITDNAIEVHIKNLRKRIATISPEPWLQTRRGLGYVLEAPS